MVKTLQISYKLNTTKIEGKHCKNQRKSNNSKNQKKNPLQNIKNNITYCKNKIIKKILQK